MDFDSLNRRQLQSLCKLNKIPANITNIAMVDALKSLEAVTGIEDILNPSRSETGSSIESPEKVEVMSPRFPRTSCRTSTRQKVKKTPADYLPATASRTTSRGVRRQLGGEYLKTPSVSSTRKKAPTTSSRQNALSQLNECEAVNNECLVDQEMKCLPKTPAAVITYSRRKGHAASTCQDTTQKKTTVQRVYSTRRSARLTEKKHAEPGVMEKEISQPVEFNSFMEDVGVTSEVDLSHSVPEKSMESGVGSLETSNESSLSSDNPEDNVGEGSVGNFDVYVPSEKLDDICNALEKLDVLVVDGSDQNSMIEKDLLMDTALESEEKVQLVKIIEEHENVDLEEKLVLNEFDSSEETSAQEGNPKAESEGISYPCEYEDSDEILMFADEKIDLNEALDVSADEQRVHVAPEVHSEEKSGQVDYLKPDTRGSSNPCKGGVSEEKLLVNDEKVDVNETLDVSVTEQTILLVLEEHSDTVLYDETRILSESDVVNTDAISFDTENPSDPSVLKLEDMSNAVLEMKSEVSECNESTNMVENLIHLSTESPSELPKLDNPDNNADKESTAEGTEENNSTNTVDVVLVNPIEQEPTVDFEPPEDAQKSIIVDTVVKTMNISNGELNVNHEQLNKKTEQKIADANELTHDPVADFSFITEENEFLNKGNDVIDYQNLSTSPASVRVMTPILDNNENSERKHQGVLVEEDKSINDKFACQTPMSSNGTSLRQLKKKLKAQESPIMGTVVDIMPITYGELDLNYKQLNQETKQKIADADEVTHDSVSDFSFITEENQIANKANDVIDNRGLSNSPASIRARTPILDNDENSDRSLQGVVVEEDIIINEKGVHQKPMSLNAISLRKLKKQLKSQESLPVDTSVDLMPIRYGGADLNSEHLGQETEQKMDDHQKSMSVNEISLRQLKKQLKAQQSIKEDPSADLMPITYGEPDLNSEQLNQKTEQKIDDADFSFTAEENQVSNKANDVPSLINCQTSTRGMIQISGNDENNERILSVVGVEEDKGINEITLEEKPKNLNDISMRQLKKKLKALSIKNNMNTNKDDKVTEARPALQVVNDNQLATGEEN